MRQQNLPSYVVNYENPMHTFVPKLSVSIPRPQVHTIANPNAKPLKKNVGHHCLPLSLVSLVHVLNRVGHCCTTPNISIGSNDSNKNGCVLKWIWKYHNWWIPWPNPKAVRCPSTLSLAMHKQQRHPWSKRLKFYKSLSLWLRCSLVKYPKQERQRSREIEWWRPVGCACRRRVVLFVRGCVVNVFWQGSCPSVSID